MKISKLWVWISAAALLVLALSCFIPAVNQTILHRADQVRLRLIYLIRPPERSVFTPAENDEVARIVQATMTAFAFTPEPSITPEPSATFSPDVPTPTPLPPTPTRVPLPASALIADVPFVDQNFGSNNCAPANLTMALKFWGFEGTREEVAKALKPFERDKNVMPYELVDFVTTNTSFRALTRIGGTPELLKTLISSGYPVVVERGVYLRDLTGRNSWMGHYQVVYGYDDAQRLYQVKDSFEANGSQFTETYDELLKGWFSFNYAFVLVYPSDRESQVMELLGAHAAENGAAQAAFDQAVVDINATQGQDQFFAWYNMASSQVTMQDFAGAAQTYDQAFAVYAGLPAEYGVRPWRILWYQTGPYFAYYYAGRYNDVIALADTTISAASEPFIEESFYWRGLAKAATGDRDGAAADLRKSLEYHPNFSPSLAAMQQLGVTP